MHRILIAVILSSLVACASSTTKTNNAAVAPPVTAAEPDASVETSPALEEGEMTLERALRVVAELEEKWPLDEDNPLLHPTTLEQAEQILKLDQVRLFPFAIEFLAAQGEKDAQALHGQIELAWGESYMLIMEVLGQVQEKFESTAAILEIKGELSEAEQKHLNWLHDNLRYTAPRLEALQVLAADHIALGSDIAEEIIEAHPDSYLGYRLSADYYRILRDWESFNIMVDNIRATNPDSNGLLFLLGAEAFQSKKDLEAAEGYYRQALANDPHFVRAQAHLLVIQSDIKKTHAELLALEAMSPGHQFVAIAGESIKRAVSGTEAMDIVTGK